MSSPARSASPVPPKTNPNTTNPILDENEKKLAEERANNALKLQRKQRLDVLVKKRKLNFTYLKKLHQGGTFWLNITLFTKDDIQRYAKNVVRKQRIESYFLLGLSISKIIALNPGPSIVRAFSQLIEEWEYFNSGTAMQSVKYVMAKNSPCIYPQTVPIEGMGDLARPSVYKFNNTVVYEYLQIVPINFDLDYPEVIISLCDMMEKLYDKLFHKESFNNHLIYETIVRLDTRIKHHIINMISKELTEISTNKIHTNTNYLRSLYEQKQQIQILQDNYSLAGKVNISNPLLSTNKDPLIPEAANKNNTNENTSELIDETKIELYI